MICPRCSSYHVTKDGKQYSRDSISQVFSCKQCNKHFQVPLENSGSSSELKRIADKISVVGIIQGNSEDVVMYMRIKSIIEHMEIPELVGHEEKENYFKA